MLVPLVVGSMFIAVLNYSLQLATHREYCGYRPLQEASKYVTPVVFVVRDARQSHVDGHCNQEELYGGSEDPGPLCLQSGLDIQLQEEKKDTINIMKGSYCSGPKELL